MEHLHGSDFHGLAGMALDKKSVEFIKSNISTAQDISQIAGAIDGLFDGQKQINQKRFSDNNTLGQYKSAANDVIDAKIGAGTTRRNGDISK